MSSRMAVLEMLELYPSPYSERLRWVLDAKGVPYTRRAYQIIAGEEQLRGTTGFSTVPVLFADGRVIGDSNAAADWIEAAHPTPPLLPTEPRARAQVRGLELAVTEAMGPFARLMMIGRWQQLGLAPLAEHFAAKYGWSEHTERQAKAVVEAFVPDLARAVTAAPYLVGDRFTRADLTVAALLATVMGHPADDLFELDAGTRPMFSPVIDDEHTLATLRTWRDGIYRQHRGRRVTPAAA
jgi:glutathione S-transferase